MAKKTNVVANEKNSIISTNVKNVVTNNSSKVEDSAKGFFDSLAALSSADSVGGLVTPLGRFLV